MSNPAFGDHSGARFERNANLAHYMSSETIAVDWAVSATALALRMTTLGTVSTFHGMRGYIRDELVKDSGQILKNR